MQNKVCGKKYADGQKFPPIHTDSGVADKYSISVKNKLSILSKNVFYGFCLSINIRKICNRLLPGAITFHIFTVNIKDF